MHLSVVQLAKAEAGSGGGVGDATVTERLAWTLQHSLMSITATSFTTAAAFAANVASTVTPIRLFGAFMVRRALRTLFARPWLARTHILTTGRKPN